MTYEQAISWIDSRQWSGTGNTEIRMEYGCRMSMYQFYNMVAEQEQNI